MKRRYWALVTLVALGVIGGFAHAHAEARARRADAAWARAERPIARWQRQHLHVSGVCSLPMGQRIALYRRHGDDAQSARRAARCGE